MGNPVPYPPFSKENVPLWFAKMESAFFFNEIDEDEAKYNHVVFHVPYDSLKEVQDTILNIYGRHRYPTIKSEMIKQMIIKRMKETKFGNETPSEYLQKLEDLAGQHNIIDSEIKNVWLNNLPETLRESVSSGTGNMDELCEIGKIADKAIVLVNQPPHKTSIIQTNLGKKISRKEWCEMMRRHLESLDMKLVKYMANDEYDDNDEEQLLSQGNTLQKEEFNVLNWNTTSTSSKIVCWYHANFGAKAIACVAPCVYKVLSDHLSSLPA